jgi:hypothetical protein
VIDAAMSERESWYFSTLASEVISSLTKLMCNSCELPAMRKCNMHGALVGD